MNPMADGSAPDSAGIYPRICPHEIRRAAMKMQWQELTMVHWRYEPAVVQSLLPDSLEVDVFDGSAWVGLIPFQMRVNIPGISRMTRWLHFPETNVRTYVRNAAGYPGVWFFSLEASSLPAVVSARAGYQLPYFWSAMSIDRDSNKQTIRYMSERRWPGPKGASSSLGIEIGDARSENEIDELENFLTSRWALYGAFAHYACYAKMYHEPWPLYRASIIECDDELVTAAGLPTPTGKTVVHYSPGVDVRCGWPGRPPK